MKEISIKVKGLRIRSTNHSRIPMQLKSGKRILVPDPKYRKSKGDLIMLIQTQLPRGFRPIEENIMVVVNIRTYKDLDNCLKLVLDALQGAEVIKNDRAVMEIIARKKRAKLGEPEDIEIMVTGYTEERLFDDTELREETASH